MWHFLEKLVTVALPRIRDFQGVPDKSFDGRGNYSLGLKEQLLAVEGVPTVSRAREARIARAAMYHYDPNPDRQYCLPTCGDIGKRPLGVVKLFARRELAETTGLSPCVDCRPDLHPLAS